MDPHDWGKLLHILAATIWVGGAIVLNAAISRAHRSSDRGAAVRLNSEVDWMGSALIGPSAAVVIAVGIWMVVSEEVWAFSQLWIMLSLVLVGISMLLGIAYFGPEGKRITRIADERGPEDEEVRRRMSRLLWVSRFDVLMLLVVLWAMVFKPGL